MKHSKKRSAQKNEDPKIVTKSTQNEFVAVDVGFEGFKEDFKKLTSEEQSEFFDTLNKIQKMTWQQIWDTSTKTPGQKRGLNYEKIEGQLTPSGEQVCSIRITQKFRARVVRADRWMRFISLHPDHDSAYKK